MFVKVLCVLALAMAVTAAPGHSSQHFTKYDGHAEPVTIHDHHGHHYYDYYTHPKYEFKYEVKDPHTHDRKTHDEYRDGDVVKGYYSLDEPDGSIRHVHYHADKHTGYHAEVTHTRHPGRHRHH